MKNLRNREGFTLMELLVAIVVGSLVTLAATTVLLLGLRMNRHSMDTVKQQNNTRVVLSLLEDLASESSIKKVITSPDAWYICSTADEMPEEGGSAEDVVLVAFDSHGNAICTGGTVETKIVRELVDGKYVTKSTKYTYSDGAALLEGVYASHAVLDEERLLSFSIETEEGTYSSSTYCRMAPAAEKSDPITDILDSEDPEKDPIEIIVSTPANTSDARKEFLKVATSQRGSPGLILEKITIDEKTVYISTGEYYVNWYHEYWEDDTPWCACFVVWALDSGRWKFAQEGPELLRTPLTREKGGVSNNLSHVDSFIKYLDGAYKNEVAAKTGTNAEQLNFWYPCELKLNGNQIVSRIVDPNYEVTPGDLIFFDWVADNVYDCDHVGIVLTVTNEYVYTVEGNTADMVAVRRYRTDDPRIMGYGVLDWVTNDNLEQQTTPEAAN